jgi:hypothetical protein
VFFFPTDLQVVGWAGAWQPIREGRQLPQELPRVARVHHVVGAAFRDLQGQECCTDCIVEWGEFDRDTLDTINFQTDLPITLRREIEGLEEPAIATQ